MLRRRRKPRVVWLPPASTLRIGADPAAIGTQNGGFQFVLDPMGPTATGDIFTTVTDVVGDLQTADFQQANLATTSLADIYSSGYRLRRLVGKIFLGMGQSASGVDSVGTVLVTIGFIILRAAANGDPLDVANPLNYSPAAIQNWSDPWIWRRSWQLSNFNAALGKGGGFAFPETNVTSGPSGLDGPHVDAKTARVIGLEERLFMVTSATALDSSANAYTVSVSGELRALATLRQNVGNRGNASR